ncbi:DMT family transporter [Candidatus Mycobacterium methanotrophicum]|uniref:DMT family transporter n=1 Tax=Candidatus Mycobacterium methanotrophicum TaxID=2943498 RepID=A0ABY4QPI8_9MYCO|nr:DMT family transporter [Candidatus Mycobacterium methanotrophicum]UQX11703.1 DMT family transporter [Candidatus Mycobacterium methanotrophicum]
MAKTEISALLALSSALCIAMGDVLQQRAAHRIADRSVGHIGLFLSLLGNQRWWYGALLLATSIALQAAALGQGSVLLVQALLTLSLLFALPLNARLSHRTISSGEWIWASLLTAAVIVVVVVGSPQAGRSSASLHTWAAVAIVLGPLLVACVVAGEIRGGAVAAVLFAFVSGSLWGVFAVLTKEVVARLGGGWSAVMQSPELYACVLAAVGGVVWSQSAFRAGPLTASLPALQMSQPVVAVVLGVVVLGETLNTSRAGMIALEAAVVVMAAAVFQLARVDALTTRDRVRRKLRGVGKQRALRPSQTP